MREGDGGHDYGDIIHLERPASEKHPRMPVRDRAAQFLPFAALSGYGDALRETARLTDQRIELSDDAKAVLNGKLSLLAAQCAERPWAAITYFQPDASKAGGAYVTVSGTVRRVDEAARRVCLANGVAVPIGDILQIECGGIGFGAPSAEG